MVKSLLDKADLFRFTLTFIRNVIYNMHASINEFLFC